MGRMGLVPWPYSTTPGITQASAILNTVVMPGDSAVVTLGEKDNDQRQVTASGVTRLGLLQIVCALFAGSMIAQKASRGERHLPMLISKEGHHGRFGRTMKDEGGLLDGVFAHVTISVRTVYK